MQNQICCETCAYYTYDEECQAAAMTLRQGAGGWDLHAAAKKFLLFTARVWSGQDKCAII